MIVAILISVHLLADFLFQSSAVLERKRQKRKFLFLHCSIYFVVFEILFFILFQSGKAFLLGVIILILHFLINLTNNLYIKLQGYENFKIIILYILIFSIILDPASVFIRKLFISISSKTYPKIYSEELKAGNIIGKLERIIIAILLLNNQFGVIGFVLTAKSIARFKQMENRNFAEKYLIGTLTSFLIVLTTVLILKGLL